MKFHYNYNKLAMSTVLNISFPMPNLNADVVHFLNNSFSLTEETIGKNGIQNDILVKVLYDNIINNVCRNLVKVSNRIFSWTYNIMDGHFVIVIQFGNNKTLLKKVTSMIFKNTKPHKLWPAYSKLCKMMKCETNPDDFIFRSNILSKNISTADVHVSGKININDKDFQNFMKVISEKLVTEIQKGGKEHRGTGDNSGFAKSPYHIHIKSPYICMTADFLNTRRINSIQIGEDIYMCHDYNLSSLLNKELIVRYAAKFNKLKDHAEAALTHDMLLVGIPCSMVKKPSVKEFEAALDKLLK